MLADPKQADKERIRSLLFKVGDDRKKVLGNIRGLVSLLQDDMAEHRDTILNSFVECAKYLPIKSGIVGASLALLNGQHRVFVADTITAIYNELKYAVSQSNLHISAGLLRSLIECVNCGCLSVDSLFRLLKSLVSSSITAGYRQGTFGLYLVLSAITCISPSLMANNPQVSEFVDNTTQWATDLLSISYIQRRESISPSAGHRDQLELVIECIKFMRSNSWTNEVLIQPFLLNGMIEQLSGNGINITVHSLPAEHDHLTATIVRCEFIPPVIPQIAGERDGPYPSKSDMWILQDILINTTVLFNDSVGECAKALLKIPFIHPSFEHILASTLLALCMQSPKIMGIPQVFYSSVLQRCIVLQESLKPATIQAIVTLTKSHQLNVEAEFLLADAIALLVNNNLPIDFDQLANNPRLVSKCLECLARYTFVNSISTKVSASVHGLIPPEPGCGHPFQPNEVDSYEKMKQVVRIKDGSAVEVSQVMNELGDEVVATECFAKALVENGSKTTTHFLKLIELYKGIAKTLPSGLLVATLFEFWGSTNYQRLERCLSVCLREDLIDAESVAKRIEINENSFSSYSMVAMLLNHMFLCEVPPVQSVIDETLQILFSKSNEFMRNWILKNYVKYIDPKHSSLVALFK